jgi:ComF family protein
MFKSWLNLFLQSNCPLCQRSTPETLCEYCIKQLQTCRLQNPSYLWQQPLPVFAWGMYGGSVKRAIATMKYDNQPAIAQILGQFLGEAWLLSSPSPQQKLTVVPIPIHPHKLKERSYNQAELIAVSFCATTGLKLKVNGLERRKETKAQFGLSASERQENLADAFALGADFHRRHPDTPVLLVDDIYTSGATAKSAISTLQHSKIAVLGLAAVASAHQAAGKK